MLELYHDWSSFCSIKVRLCLAEKNLTWESRFIDLMKLDQLQPDYLKLNPNAVVPTLVHDGRAIWESSSSTNILTRHSRTRRSFRRIRLPRRACAIG